METRGNPPSRLVAGLQPPPSGHNHGVVSVRVDRDTNHRELVGHTLSELKASNTSDGESILISVGDPWEGYRGHTVANPVRVRLIDAPRSW